jgi:diaminohydroxyphosphoribosylaminopyrimidine deaminase/5-amino-6-(5-phosphoribosylamino)uracil reductase
VLPDLLRSLCEHDVTNLMVEGGPAVLGAFLRDGLVDEAWAFVAPILIGGVDAPGVITDIGPTDLARMLRPLLATAQRSGVDTFHRLQFTDPAALLKRGAGDRRGESR